MKDLASFQRDLLILVAEEPKEGSTIKSEMGEYYESDIADGRLYPNLDVLVEKGYVEKYDSISNEYHITERGKDAISEHVSWRSSSL